MINIFFNIKIQKTTICLIFPEWKLRIDSMNYISSLLVIVPLFIQTFLFSAKQPCSDSQVVSNATTTIFYGASTEPSIAVNPKNSKRIVATWQQDRINNGGALEAGIAHSEDGGKHWKRSVVPFQICSGGFIQRVSDVWLSFSKDGKKVFLCALVTNATKDPKTDKQQGIVVTHSKDNGASWSTPTFVSSSQGFLTEPTGAFHFDDKNSITLDPNEERFGYIVWDRFAHISSAHSTTQFSRTVNGGKTWRPAKLLYDPFPDLLQSNMSNGIESDCSTLDNVVVVLPKANPSDAVWKKDPFGDDENKALRFSGNILNFMVRIFAKPSATDAQYVNDAFPFQYTLFDIACVRSSDHGKTWEKTANVVTPLSGNEIFTGGYTYLNGKVIGGLGTQLRAGDLIPSFTVNPKNGILYVVWQSDQFRKDKLPQIAITTSRDGGMTWSNPAKVSRTPKNAKNPQAFTPFVAVTEDGYVGILYFDFRHDSTDDSKKTKTDAFLAIYKEVQDANGGSTKIGLDFVREIRLSKKSYIAQNGPETTQGVMTDGDYVFLVTHGNKFYTIYTKSKHGPFKKPQVLLDDNTNNALLLLDNNCRQDPFISIIKDFADKDHKPYVMTHDLGCKKTKLKK